MLPKGDLSEVISLAEGDPSGVISLVEGDPSGVISLAEEAATKESAREAGG